MLKSRKLYEIRHYRPGYVFGKTVGFKCRLLPRAAAMRVKKRLKAIGRDIEISPMIVNLTPAQCAYLDNRYPAKAKQ